MSDQGWVLLGFNLFVLAMLALDLGVFHRKAHTVGVREAMTWTGVWVALALAFNLVIYFWQGPEVATQFLTGYLIEKALSVDNIFVILLLFGYFAVPSQYQHRVLFWGILGALAMRAAMIWAGAALIHQFHWILYVFGAFLVFTGIRMAMKSETEIHPERNPVVRLFRRVMPVTPEYHGDHFVVRRDGRWAATPLLLCLVMVECSDLLFAVDSIPAIFAVTEDPFIVYTSNVFAILGLRSLFFALSGVLPLFHYLKYGLAAVLVFVGGKMLLAGVYKFSAGQSLAVIATILGIAVVASLVRTRREKRQAVRTRERAPAP